MRCRLAVLLAAASVAACSTLNASNQPPAEQDRPALFYAKDGRLYVSDPAGTPGRPITDGPADTQPAPSPDGKRVAYIHQTGREKGAGEIWVVDVASGKRRPLVDPARIGPRFQADDEALADTPRWSPDGDRIAFVKTTQGNGGFLQTASADTGAVLAPPEPMFAARDFSWSPDGRRIAWVSGRSDVRPNDVCMYTVGGSSVSVVTGANASSVTFAGDGESILFANAQVSSPPSPYANFLVREGGIYTVTPGSAPEQLLSGPESYGDVAALPSGSIGFTQASANPRSQSWVRAVRVLDRDSDSPRTLGETSGVGGGPAWAGDSVAYVGADESHPLFIGPTMAGGNAQANRVDVGVDSFAWAGG